MAKFFCQTVLGFTVLDNMVPRDKPKAFNFKELLRQLTDLVGDVDPEIPSYVQLT